MPRLHHDGDPRLTCSHECHLARGNSLGGEDWGLDVGTPIKAPFDGTYRYHAAGTGGYTFTGIPADARLRGMVTQAMHNSRANGLTLGGSAKFFHEGHVLGWSGGAPGHPGAGTSTGPHTHQHGIANGVRIAMTAAVAWMLSRLGQLAGQPSKPLTEQDDDEMRIIYVPNGSIALIGGPFPAEEFSDPKTQGFSYEAEGQVWGRVAVTPDQYTTLVRRQNARAAALAQSIAQAIPSGSAAPAHGPVNVTAVLEVTGTITPKE